ncbi:MAG: hypothetical protein ACI8XO_001940 [Verrucomicrobiales bacterium]|jgi:hypothetical protein
MIPRTIALSLTTLFSLTIISIAQSAPLQGQVVRIVQNKTTSSNPLQLAEVLVIEDTTLNNVALAGTASQSSQLSSFGPGLAIDGDLGNFHHTLDLAGGARLGK